MEIEITRAVELTPQQAQMLDLHSFLNILNVLEGELQVLGLGADDSSGVAPALLVADTIKNSLTEGALDRDWVKRLDQLERITEACLKRLRGKHPDLLATREAEESVANVQSVLRVLRIRADEHIARQAGAQTWIPHSIARLQDNFQNFLAAVERNSKGRYRIIFNIAAQEERDYVVNLKIESVRGDVIVMPPVVQDIFRDLIANARKYTRPG
jgi:signal transduction histidine kinase